MSRTRPDGGSVGRSGGIGPGGAFDPEELRRRNLSAVAMDLLYLFTTAFFAHHLLRGFWPAVIGAVPLATLLYFGWKSSRAFFAAQVVAIGASVAATYAGLVPL